MMEEYERMRVERERLIQQVTTLLVDRKFLMSKIKELENPSDNEFVDHILVLPRITNLRKEAPELCMTL